MNNSERYIKPVILDDLDRRLRKINQDYVLMRDTLVRGLSIRYHMQFKKDLDDVPRDLFFRHRLSDLVRQNELNLENLRIWLNY